MARFTIRSLYLRGKSPPNAFDGKSGLDVVVRRTIIVSEWNRIPATQSVAAVSLREKKYIGSASERK
jgi:hypothetical protein